jgi:bacterioferritin (cytochrome b1)
MPSHVFDDPKHWRQRAEQARALAEQMSDPASREMMLGIVKDYEQLAEWAEQRAQEKRKLTES